MKQIIGRCSLTYSILRLEITFLISSDAIGTIGIWWENNVKQIIASVKL